MTDDKETFREKGTVTAVEGGRITVVIDENEVNEERCISCGACLREEAGKTLTAAVPDEEISVGDMVVLECTPKNVYLAIFLMFFVPLVGLGVGAAIGYFIPALIWLLEPWHTGVTVLSSLAGMTLAFAGVLIYSRRRIEPKHPDPVVVEVEGKRKQENKETRKQGNK